MINAFSYFCWTKDPLKTYVKKYSYVAKHKLNLFPASVWKADFPSR